jgi:hypothetical protein
MGMSTRRILNSFAGVWGAARRCSQGVSIHFFEWDLDNRTMGRHHGLIVSFFRRPAAGRVAVSWGGWT